MKPTNATYPSGASAPGAPSPSRRYKVAQELPASSTVAPATAMPTSASNDRYTGRADGPTTGVLRRRVVVVIGAVQQVRVGDRDDGAEQHGREPQVHRARDVQGDRGRTHQATDDGADGPHRVQRVDDRPAVVALQPKTVDVLCDIGHRIAGAGGEQGRSEDQRRSGHTGDHDERREGDGGDQRDPCRLEPPDQRGRRQPGDQGTGGERRHGIRRRRRWTSPGRT